MGDLNQHLERTAARRKGFLDEQRKLNTAERNEQLEEYWGRYLSEKGLGLAQDSVARESGSRQSS